MRRPILDERFQPADCRADRILYKTPQLRGEERYKKLVARLKGD